MDWDARISSHIKRLRDQKIEQGISTGSPAPGSVRGRPVSDGEAAKMPFEQQKFAYAPPGYGPQGEVTEEERVRLDGMGWKLTRNPNKTERSERPAAIEVGEGGKTGATRADIESWRGGVGAEDQQPKQTVVLDDNDFEKMIEEGEYPFEKPLPATTEAATQPDIEDDIFAFPNTGLSDEGKGDVPLHQNAQTNGPGTQGNEIDWSATLNNMVNDTEWLTQELGGMDGADQQSVRKQPANGTIEETIFQHGSQDVGETQIAERAGGEFLEEFGDGAPSTEGRQIDATAAEPEAEKQSNEQQQPTPPASQKTPGLGLGGKLFSGLNLGSSILGKRKDAPAGAGGEQGKEKVSKTVEDDGLAA